MRVGETSPVIRTRLGFHIVQLTDAKPEEEMALDQSQDEIRLTLENQKRPNALGGLKADLSQQSEFTAAPSL